MMTTTSSTRYIVGCAHGFHDGAVGVIDREYNLIKFARQTERVTGIKHDPSKYESDVLEVGNIFETAFYEKPRYRQLRQFISGEFIRPKEHGYGTYIYHHWAHAAAAYYTRPYWDKEPVCVVIDAIGELTTASIWYKKEKVWSESYPVSLGLFYSAITKAIGLQPNRDEHLTMAMAGCGKGWYDVYLLESFQELRYHDFHKGFPDDLLKEYQKFEIASTAQYFLETEILKIMKEARKYSKYLCYAGGVALNCVANAKVDLLFDDMWIFPNPGDAGAALGAALAVHDKRVPFEHNFLGMNFSIDTPNPKDIARHILKEGVAGICNGPDEFGPRALGNRSLISDPRGNVADRIYEIKNRAWYSPLAPVILEEYFHDYFRGRKDRYMSYVCKTGIDTDHMPKIKHKDGSARVQAIPPGSPSILRKVLEEWYELTNCPILINTSLNLKGKPVFSDIDSVREFEGANGIRIF